jgi:transposase
MKNEVLGIDISKAKFDAALLLNDRLIVKKFGNDCNGFNECKKWLNDLQCHPHICLEATGIYGIAFASFMFENNYKVSVVNPVQIKRFAESELLRNKTDKVDAHLIARYCLLMSPKAWRPEPKCLSDLKQFVTYLEALTVMKFQEQNRLQHVNNDVAKAIKNHLIQLDKNIKEVKQAIDAIIFNNKDLKEKKSLLETIPGVGYETIIRVLAYLRNIDDFGSAKQVSAFAGLNPRQRQSGSSVRQRTKLSKTGDPKIRKTLYMPALVSIRYNPLTKEFYERLLKIGKCKMAAIGAVMRKLLYIIYGVLKNRTPFDKNLRLSQKLLLT